MVRMACGRERPFDRSQKFGTEMPKIWNPFWIVHELFGWLVLYL